MTHNQSQQMNVEALRDLRILVDEYDPQNSDWGFRRAVIKSVLDRLAVLPAPKAAGDAAWLMSLNDYHDHHPLKPTGDVRAAVIEDLAVMARVKSIGIRAKQDAKNTYVVSLTFEGGEQPTLQQFQNLRTAALSQAPAPGAAAEKWMTQNPDGSVTFDAYAGKSRDELKDRCSELCTAMEDWQFAAVSAATDGGNELKNVREPYRSKIERVIEAYSDDEIDAAGVA